MSTRTYSLTAFAKELINMVAGLVIWAGHFAAVYGAHALICARYRAAASSIPLIVGVATVAGLAGSTAVLVFALHDLQRSRRDDDASASQRFLSYTSATIAGFSLLAIAWVALPVLFIRPCSGF